MVFSDKRILAMLDPTIFDDIIKRLTDVIPPSLKDVEADLQQKFRSILQSTFAKMDLVTREEFDVQTKVLARTRAKLDAIEQQIASLNQKTKTQ